MISSLVCFSVRSSSLIIIIFCLTKMNIVVDDDTLESHFGAIFEGAYFNGPVEFLRVIGYTEKRLLVETLPTKITDIDESFVWTAIDQEKVPDLPKKPLRKSTESTRLSVVMGLHQRWALSTERLECIKCQGRTYWKYDESRAEPIRNHRYFA